MRGRVFTVREAVSAGIPRHAIYALWHRDQLVHVGHGLFAMPRLDLGQHETLAEAAKRVPNGVICLLSALAFHGLTTQSPQDVWMAIPEKAWKPRTDSLPLHVVRFSGPAYREGVEEHRVGRMPIRVYSPAKTVADCFKYRNKFGLEVALEALRDYWRQRRGSLDELVRYAEVCRVANVMRPYLEALVQ
ncbi:MAG: transcriptional regulator [Chloroflexi bacterium]|nr:transcriptional regulator [Chloroflexota bacterium]